MPIVFDFAIFFDYKYCYNKTIEHIHDASSDAIGIS